MTEMARRLKAIPGGAFAHAEKKPKPVAFDFNAPGQAIATGPGEYAVTIISARMIQRGGKTTVMLAAVTDAGEPVRMYAPVPQPLVPGCRYLELAAVALGRAPERGTSLDPQALFVGKRFRAFIGWRKSKHPKGEGEKADHLALEGPKDTKDYMRIHTLLSRLDD